MKDMVLCLLKLSLLLVDNSNSVVVLLSSTEKAMPGRIQIYSK